MADPLLGSQRYIAEWEADTDELWLTGTTPGPAGSMEIAFEGVVVALDAANPEVVNSVRVDDASRVPATSTRTLLDKLLGAAVVDEALLSLHAADGSRHRLGETPTSRRFRTQLSPILARLAVASSSATGEGLLPHERSLAHLEALALVDRLGLEEDVPDYRMRLENAAVELVDSAAELLHSLGDGVRDRQERLMAADICDKAAAVLTSEAVASQLRTTASDLRHPQVLEPFLAAAMSAPIAELLSVAAPVLDASVAMNSLPTLVAGVEPMISHMSHDEYEVRLPGWAARSAGWWVRAFRGDDRVPLVVVALVADNGDAVAHFLLTEHDAESFVIDIVDNPGEPRPSERIATFKAAIAAGKRAMRLERLDRRDEAARAWERTSELHSAAGDSWRAKMAAAIASDQFASTQGRRTLMVRPVVADVFGPNA